MPRPRMLQRSASLSPPVRGAPQIATSLLRFRRLAWWERRIPVPLFLWLLRCSRVSLLSLFQVTRRIADIQILTKPSELRRRMFARSVLWLQHGRRRRLRKNRHSLRLLYVYRRSLRVGTQRLGQVRVRVVVVVLVSPYVRWAERAVIRRRFQSQPP